MKRQEKGRLGEKLAQLHLEKMGYVIIGNNYRSPDGEIDIIARKDSVLVFIEVRSKSTLDLGTAAESITSTKRQRLIKTALSYIAEHNEAGDARFDFISVWLGYGSPSFEIIENAFSEDPC